MKTNFFFLFVISSITCISLFSACGKETNSPTNTNNQGTILFKTVSLSLNNIPSDRTEYFYNADTQIIVIKKINLANNIGRLDSFFRDNLGRIVKFKEYNYDTLTQIVTSDAPEIKLVFYIGNSRNASYIYIRKDISPSQFVIDSSSLTYANNGYINLIQNYTRNTFDPLYALVSKSTFTYDLNGNSTFRFDSTLSNGNGSPMRLYEKFGVTFDTQKSFPLKADVLTQLLVSKFSSYQAYNAITATSQLIFERFGPPSGIQYTRTVNNFYNTNNKPDSFTVICTEDNTLSSKAKFYYR
jgi:hypothetical protein